MENEITVEAKEDFVWEECKLPVLQAEATQIEESSLCVWECFWEEVFPYKP